jgi:hypothetical protein
MSYTELIVRIHNDEKAHGGENYVEYGKMVSGVFTHHNPTGPAIVFDNGDKSYWIDGLLHNTEGPAIVRVNGENLYFVKGKSYSEKQFNNLFAKNPSCEGKVIEIDGQKYKLTPV